MTADPRNLIRFVPAKGVQARDLRPISIRRSRRAHGCRVAAGGHRRGWRGVPPSVPRARRGGRGRRRDARHRRRRRRPAGAAGGRPCRPRGRATSTRSMPTTSRALVADGRRGASAPTRQGRERHRAVPARPRSTGSHDHPARWARWVAAAIDHELANVLLLAHPRLDGIDVAHRGRPRRRSGRIGTAGRSRVARAHGRAPATWSRCCRSTAGRRRDAPATCATRCAPSRCRRDRRAACPTRCSPDARRRRAPCAAGCSSSTPARPPRRTSHEPDRPTHPRPRALLAVARPSLGSAAWSLAAAAWRSRPAASPDASPAGGTRSGS